MGKKISLGEITAEVVLKDIKNIHLSVYPPNGRVRISAPKRMDIETIRIFAISKLGWIKKQQKKLREQERESPREYMDRESHYVWGKRFLLNVVESDNPPLIEVKHSQMILRVRPGTSEAKRQDIVEEWYRELLKKAASDCIARWEQTIGVKVARLYIQRMKTRWGSCNHTTNSIRLNTELAKKPRECLEYIIVHEMVHLLEPKHNARFITLVEQFIPRWQFIRDQLNRLPVRHEDWEY